ncbi:hypothetical protein PSENEW3_00001412 [Picochlorum sp. SENEW3]|nr:hypothetical protein PSENEW3_00001412 [Picochlorum sp. SENEW3]
MEFSLIKTEQKGLVLVLYDQGHPSVREIAGSKSKQGKITRYGRYAGIGHGQGSLKPVSRSSRRVARQSSKKNDGEMDIIEKLVGKIFGRQALETDESFGLKRMNAEDTPELFPATVDEFAEPLPEDTGDVRYYRKLLKNTQLEKIPLELVFDSDKDGFSMESFGQKVYTMGASLLVATIKDSNAIVGGYNPRGWIGLNEDRDSIAAFLFTWPDGNISSSMPIKLQKVGGYSMAVMDYPSEGIRFGPDGLKFLAPGRERIATSRLGSYYARMPDGSKSIFPNGEKSVEFERVQVYVSSQGPETYNLDGIIWKTGRNAE